jgi:acetyl esterase/lipase
VHLFFHGGYWRAFDRSDYSFVARPITEAGAIAVIANYGLMPGDHGTACEAVPFGDSLDYELARDAEAKVRLGGRDVVGRRCCVSADESACPGPSPW